jgi:CheY-like chemotaxis protein
MQNSNINFTPPEAVKNIYTIIKPVKISVLKTIINKINNPESVELKKAKQISYTSKFPLNILIAEDNKINMLLTKTIINKFCNNAVITEAANGLEAVEFFKDTNPDIVLMDIQMPLMNGYEATNEIRKLNPDAIIIALTAGVITGEKERCLAVGMKDYIIKPIDRNIFEDTLLKWINTIDK